MKNALAPLEFLDKALFSEIRARKAMLKIILKTKNDAFFIEDWIIHHAGIVGYENIIIMDNCSIDETVTAVYEKFRGQVIIARFRGFHNFMHDTSKASELYEAVRASSQYFIFLDTDEFLFQVKGEMYFSGPEMLNDLASVYPKSIPTTWVYSVAQSENTFEVGEDDGILAHGIKWGKPMVRCDSNVSGFINHNTQLPKGSLELNFAAGYFVKHFALRSPNQRIISNVNKIASRGFISNDASIADIVSLDLNRVADANVILYINEIKRMLVKIDSPQCVVALQGGMMRLRDDGRIEFFSQKEKDRVSRFIANPGVFFQ